MDLQQEVIQQNENTSYDEWIAKGKQQLVEREFDQANLSFQNALDLTDDKCLGYIQIAQANINGENISGSRKYLMNALEYANQQIDRYLEIAILFEKVYIEEISLYIHGLIKELKPDHDHQTPQSADDYKNIVLKYFFYDFTSFAQKPIEKLLQLSENKLDTLLFIIKKILNNDNNNLEFAETYCEKALSLQEDKYDTYLQIGDIFKEYSLQLSIKYYEGAKNQRPDSFLPQIYIGTILIKYEKLQEAQQYFRSQQIPEQKQVYIDIGLLLLKNEQTFDDGLEYLFKGIELSENKFDTLIELANLKEVDGRKVQKLLLEKALEIRENDQNTLEQYATHICYYQIPSLEKLYIISKVLELNPESEFFIEYKCKTLLELGLGEDIIEELNKGALKAICYKNIFLLRLQNLLFIQKKLKQGLDIFRIAVEYDSSDAYYSIVVMLFENDYFEECIQLADEYINLYPEEKQPYLFKAKSLYALKKYDEAIPFLQKTLEIGDNEQAKDLIQKIEEIKLGKVENNQIIQE